MAQAASKLLTTEQFRAWYPSDGKRYELLRGEIRKCAQMDRMKILLGLSRSKSGSKSRPENTATPSPEPVR